MTEFQLNEKSQFTTILLQNLFDKILKFITNVFLFQKFRLTEGGPAAKSGKIAVGDRLLAIKCIKNSDEINYILLENCSHETAVKAMKQCKNTAILLIEKAEDQEALENAENTQEGLKTAENPRKTEETSNEAFKNTTTESDIL